MGIGVVLLMLGLGAIAIVQNWSPTLPLILFGNATIPFPLGIWLFIALATGLLLSLLLQGLNYRPLPRPKEPPIAPRYREPQPRPKPRRRPEDWDTPVGENWEREDDTDEWDIESPPEQPTNPRPARAVDQQEQGRSTPRNPPKPEPSEPPKPQQKDGVYDADYRIITPPPPEEGKPQDWEF
ncbi:hypothetical protein VB712_05890 [Spirulina sp. CCNP1310]|uniref:hypothetical protein n=1 Tax=Spirulina sp. CCNP1310 TaxID=3110249 RepID=UPI002B1FB3A2|nr:hypothetical protein [Spirulina sp. CCNP1310]MEA5418750.1 hypothetical protein [Spirulina sp. CCNP1310]